MICVCLFLCSGLSHESHRRDVEQVYLRCSQGSLEWLYPTGAIIVNLRPNLEQSSGHMAGLHVCIKAQIHSQVEHETKMRKLTLQFGLMYCTISQCVLFRVLVCI